MQQGFQFILTNLVAFFFSQTNETCLTPVNYLAQKAHQNIGKHVNSNMPKNNFNSLQKLLKWTL